jgi:hypothetical protein
LPEKRGSYSVVFERVEKKLLCSIFNLEAGRQSYREIALQKIFNSLAPLAPGNRATGKKGSYSAVFERGEGTQF